MNRSPFEDAEAADTPLLIPSSDSVDRRISLERSIASAELTLRSLTEDEFELFHARMFRGEYDWKVGRRGRLDNQPDLFSKVAPLFTEDDGRNPSMEALRAASNIGKERGLEYSFHLNPRRKYA